MTVKTALRIFRNNVEIPIPPGSSRFIDMSYEPIGEAYQAERAIDGTLLDLGYDGFDSYRISISCSDMNSPALAGIWPRNILTIYGTEDLVEPGPAVTLTREPVPGSVRACAADGRVIAEPEGRTLNVPGAVFFRYRPILNVMVTGFSTSGREKKADVRWSLSAEEVDASASAGAVVAPEPETQSAEVVVSGQAVPGGTITLSASMGTLKSATVLVGGVAIRPDTGFSYTIPVWAADDAAVEITGQIETEDGETLAVSAPAARTWVIPLGTQSNMVGGHVSDDGVAWPAGVQIVRPDGSLSAPVNPISGPNGETGSFSIAKYFAIEFLAAHPNDSLIFVPGAFDGTCFADGNWNPGDGLYQNLVGLTNSTLAAVPGSAVRCVLIQGFESDVLENMTLANFEAALSAFIEGLRSDISGANGTTPIVMGEYPSDFVGVNAYRISFRDSILGAPGRFPFTAVASSRSPSVVPTIDGTHFTTAGLETMGRRHFGALASAEANDAPATTGGLGASGGTISEYTDTEGTWRLHVYASSGSFLPSKDGEAEVLVAGGGGGGGNGVNPSTLESIGGAGGGAGGFVFAKLQIKAGSLPVVIGAGGPAGPTTSNSALRHGSKGSQSSFAGIIAMGGGGGVGAASDTLTGFQNGGSGGGQRAPGFAPPGTGFSGQGNPGGVGISAGTISSAGGGGAGSAGGNGTDGMAGSAGLGVDVSAFFGLPSAYHVAAGAPGSGGAGHVVGATAPGGAGYAQHGPTATGCGGGPDGGNGGSGFVAIRYRIA
jgi:hypothetical protein